LGTGTKEGANGCFLGLKFGTSGPMTDLVPTGILNSPKEKSLQMTKLEGTTATMKNSLKLAVLAAGVMMTSLAAQASTITFNLAGSNTNTANNALGNQRTFVSSDGSVDILATAWSLSNLGANFAAGQLGWASGYGLWDCNATEGVNCGSPVHQIDNVSGYDFVLLQFSQAINPATISIKTFNNADLDVSYFLGNAPANLNLATVNLAQLATSGFGSMINNDVNTAATSRVVSIANSNGVNAVLIGARIGGDANADYFKIQSLSATQASGVPEPSTFAMTGAALLGVGLYSRRKRSS
jgi:hypothetical protein